MGCFGSCGKDMNIVLCKQLKLAIIANGNGRLSTGVAVSEEQVMCTGGEHPTTAQGVTLCHECATELTEDLKAAAFLWGDIQTTCARQDVGTAAVGSSGYKAPQPAVNLDALDKAQTLRVVLGGWASHLPALHPAGDPMRTALWLITQMNEIRRQAWAGDFKTELREAINACRYSTDRAAERLSLGPCLDGCPGIMTAIVGAHTARCKACGITGNVRAMQQWIIAEAWHVMGYLPDVVRWLARSGHARIDVERVKKWVQRGTLEPAACDTDTRRELFTPADVIATYRTTPTGRRHLEGSPEKRVALVA